MISYNKLYFKKNKSLHNVNSKKGKYILKKYLKKILKGGDDGCSLTTKNRCSKKGVKNPEKCYLNVSTNRCKKKKKVVKFSPKSSKKSSVKSSVKSSDKSSKKLMYTKINVPSEEFLKSIFTDLFDIFFDIYTNEDLKKDIQKKKSIGKLFMPLDSNYPMVPKKVKRWIELQCSDEAKKIASIMIDITTHVSWKEFYGVCVRSFENFYKNVKNKLYYIVFPSKIDDSKLFNKSNYWITLLMIDYFLKKRYNLPQNMIMFKTDSSNVNMNMLIKLANLYLEYR